MPSVETPPRAWGRRDGVLSDTLAARNTPTCVGKTLFASSSVPKKRKHPHVRGEDTLDKIKSNSYRETPPRAWGRRTVKERLCAVFGNTPTCVGKTYSSPQQHRCLRKHPHVRGEDAMGMTTAQLDKETPPRAWGRPTAKDCTHAQLRNTPTCVGKTLGIY